jgi:anti-anti-sigma factor
VAVATRGPEIIADLAGLGFIDSSGAAALVLARKEARRACGDLLLAAPREQVLRFLPSPAWRVSFSFRPA